MSIANTPPLLDNSEGNELLLPCNAQHHISKICSTTARKVTTRMTNWLMKILLRKP